LFIDFRPLLSNTCFKPHNEIIRFNVYITADGCELFEAKIVQPMVKAEISNREIQTVEISVPTIRYRTWTLP
jgi:hypothetical protein